MSFLLGVFSQWWKVLVPVSLLLVIGTSAIVLATFKPKYRAEAWLQIAEKPVSLVFSDNSKVQQAEAGTDTHVVERSLETVDLVGDSAMNRNLEPVATLVKPEPRSDPDPQGSTSSGLARPVTK